VSKLEQLLRALIEPIRSKWELIEAKIGSLETLEGPSTSAPSTVQASVASRDSQENRKM
jgi:hypothetical protein